MSFYNDEICVRSRIGPQGLRFLASCGLNAREDADLSVQLFREDELIAHAALKGNLVKYVASDESLRGEGLISTVMTEIIRQAVSRGQTGLLLCTRPEKVPVFSAMGFKKLAAYEKIALLERGGGFEKYIAGLEKEKKEGVSGGIVMKCDPFTRGHRYLIEYAAARVDVLHVFALKEETTAFSAADRESMIREGTEDISNVIVHGGSDYIISSATFPTYFLKETDDAARMQTGLDATLFGERIAQALNITKRFVGEEPFSPVTKMYNEALKAVLPGYGIEVTEIPRLEYGSEAVSASRVRKALREGDIAAAKALTPETTHPYLQNIRKEENI